MKTLPKQLLLEFLLSIALVTATLDPSVIQEAGTLPNNNFILNIPYFFASTWRDLRLNFNQGTAVGTQMRIETSNQRIAQAAILLDQGNLDLALEQLKDADAKDMQAALYYNNPRFNDQLENPSMTIQIANLTNHRNQVLQDVINRIRDDGNPNNDNAITGLQNALDHTKTLTEKNEVLRGMLNKQLKDSGMPSVEQLSRVQDDSFRGRVTNYIKSNISGNNNGRGAVS